MDRLGFYDYGSCMIVANREAEENGDYKDVARINRAGVVELRVPLGYLKAEEIKRIREFSEKYKSEFEHEWNSLTMFQRYIRIMDRLLYASGKGMTVAEAVEKYTENYKMSL